MTQRKLVRSLLGGSFFALAGLLAQGCFPGQNQANLGTLKVPRGSIWGMVTDQYGGALKAAAVKVNADSVYQGTTDEKGDYRIGNIGVVACAGNNLMDPNGVAACPNYLVSFMYPDPSTTSASSYVPGKSIYKQNVYFYRDEVGTDPRGNALANQNAVLYDITPVQIMVVDDMGNPVSGAVVGVMGVAQLSSETGYIPAKSSTLLTDAAGQANFDASYALGKVNGQYLVTVYPIAFPQATTSVYTPTTDAKSVVLGSNAPFNGDMTAGSNANPVHVKVSLEQTSCSKFSPLWTNIADLLSASATFSGGQTSISGYTPLAIASDSSIVFQFNKAVDPSKVMVGLDCSGCGKVGVRLTWTDPVTLVITPNTPLIPGSGNYTVSIDVVSTGSDCEYNDSLTFSVKGTNLPPSPQPSLDLASYISDKSTVASLNVQASVDWAGVLLFAGAPGTLFGSSTFTWAGYGYLQGCASGSCGTMWDYSNNYAEGSKDALYIQWPALPGAIGYNVYARSAHRPDIGWVNVGSINYPDSSASVMHFITNNFGDNANTPNFDVYPNKPAPVAAGLITPWGGGNTVYVAVTGLYQGGRETAIPADDSQLLVLKDTTAPWLAGSIWGNQFYGNNGFESYLDNPNWPAQTWLRLYFSEFIGTPGANLSVTLTPPSAAGRLTVALDSPVVTYFSDHDMERLDVRYKFTGPSATLSGASQNAVTGATWFLLQTPSQADYFYVGERIIVADPNGKGAYSDTVTGADDVAGTVGVSTGSAVGACTANGVFFTPTLMPNCVNFQGGSITRTGGDLQTGGAPINVDQTLNGPQSATYLTFPEPENPLGQQDGVLNVASNAGYSTGTILAIGTAPTRLNVYRVASVAAGPPQTITLTIPPEQSAPTNLARGTWLRAWQGTYLQNFGTGPFPAPGSTVICTTGPGGIGPGDHIALSPGRNFPGHQDEVAQVRSIEQGAFPYCPNTGGQIVVTTGLNVTHTAGDLVVVVTDNLGTNPSVANALTSEAFRITIGGVADTSGNAIGSPGSILEIPSGMIQ